MTRIRNAFTVDVEDYFQVSAFADSVDRQDWGSFESRVDNNTTVILDMLDEADVKATFFILGWVAERHPSLVKQIANKGHEVACHGYSHQLVYDQSPELFRDETFRSKKILEDISGKEVLGYRAASYSITEKSLWALDILADAGFKYDSSIFPIRHDRYGMPGSPTVPHVLKLESGRELVEFPLSTVGPSRLRIPVAGGGYFRIYPYFVTKFAYRYLNKKTNLPVIFYTHPWEVDPGQPKISTSRLSRFRHYTNLNRTRGRIEALLRDFEFTTAVDVLKNQKFLD